MSSGTDQSCSICGRPWSKCGCFDEHPKTVEQPAAGERQQPRGFADLADLPEDERIAIICRTAAAGEVVAVVVDDDEKADRYIRKMGDQVRIVGRTRGGFGASSPGLANAVTIRVGPKES